MADRKVLYRSGGAFPEVSPTADRIRAIGMVTTGPALTLVASGATATLDAANTRFNLSAGIDLALNGTKLGGTSGDTLVGDAGGFSYFAPTGATVRGALEGIDAKLGTLSQGIGVVSFSVAEAFTAGMFARISANNTVSKAIATSLAAARVIGVAETAIPSGTGDITTGDGALIESVQLATGLTLAANEDVFLSKDTAGYGTNVEPTGSGEVVIKVGVVKDASTYVGGTGLGAKMILKIETPSLIA
jgi:hypothetical protein